MREVLESEQLVTALTTIAEQNKRSLSSVKAEAADDLKEMAVRPGRFSVAGWDKFCSWLSRAYRLDYRPAEVEELRRLNQSSALIFLPNHRSYLDPMVLRSALLNHGFAPNNVLGGANLALWPLSLIGQRNGIVFIRREFRDDPVYRAVLQAYLAHLIQTKQNLEWYIEGGRTRTGKLRPPRLGVLSYVMDAFEDIPDHDVQVIPTSIIYDQQHEVSAISEEEMGGRKKAESIGWLYNFAKDQSRRLGRAHLRFGEPLSLRDAVSLTVDEEGKPRPRLAVPKVAFEVANRINAVAPITPSALITFALLDNGDRAITVDEGLRVMLPVLEYIGKRGLPMTEDVDLSRHGSMRDALHQLVTEGVVTRFDGGNDRVFYVELEKQHEAAFYRNTIIHFFVTRAITELAALEAVEDDAADMTTATWENARRLKDLLKFEFFFTSTAKFADEVVYETTLINPEWEQRTYTAAEVRAELGKLDVILAHRVIGPFFEAYSVLADELAARGGESVDSEELVQHCLGVARQRWLQRTLPTAESISRDYFRNGAQLLKHLDLLESEDEGLAARREELAVQFREIVRRLDTLRRIAQEAGEPVIIERAPTITGGTNG